MKKLFAVIFLTALAAAPVWADEVDVIKRLEDIRAGQQNILKALEEIKAELQVVKIRATRE